MLNIRDNFSIESNVDKNFLLFYEIFSFLINRRYNNSPIGSMNISRNVKATT